MIKNFTSITYNFSYVYDEVLKDMETLVVKIVEAKASADAVRFWLYSQYDRNHLVVDYLGTHDFFDLLNHPVIVKTVDQIWMGKYDLLQGFSVREVVMLRLSPPDYYIINHGIYVDEIYSIFHPKHILGYFKYMIYSSRLVLADVISEQKKTISFEPRQMIK